MGEPPSEFVALLRLFMERAAAMMDEDHKKRCRDAGIGERFRRMQEEHTLAARLGTMRQRHYDALRAHDFDLYRRCIQAGEAVTLNHGLAGKVTADIEWAVIGMVCDALGITPDKPEPFRSPPPKSEPNLPPSTLHAAAPNGHAPRQITGFSGDACRQCGNFSLIRSGKCQTCQICGATDGCS